MNQKIIKNLILIGLGIVGFIFVYYNYLLLPLNDRYRDDLKKLNQTESKLVEMKRRALELPKLQSEMKLLEQEVEGLEKSLPKDKEIAELLRTITKTAQRYELKVTNFAPMPAVPQPNYNEVPFQLTLQGNFHSLALFLTEVGQQPRILSVRNINFLSFTGGTKERSQTVSVNFVLVAYTFKG